ncbi:hypothetical protein L195_g006618 [Trifolium pratense]|uniref:Uncharacterized protein n=1 Tax=Trifolium pratense TaxID=57577 RepID=A0A2K3P434_TRIPR|nr:hypothetical protein L195_g006618 [Trifolium pratense]
MLDLKLKAVGESVVGHLCCFQWDMQYSLHRHALWNLDASPDFMNALSEQYWPSSIKKDISPTPGIGSGVNYYWACSLRLSTSCLTSAEELPGSLVCVASASCCNSGMLGGLCARQSHHIADPRYHP